MPLATAGEIRVLDGLLDGVYLSLHTGSPGNTGASEVTQGDYARRPVAFNSSGDNPTVYANSAVVQFAQASSNWGTITHFGLWSAATSGSFLAWAAVDNSRPIGIGDIARWEAGELKVSAD